MPRYCSEAEFEELVAGLANHLRKETLQYVVRSGKNHGTLSGTGLDQMSVNLREIAMELLVFGANIWPESAKDDSVVCEVIPLNTTPPLSLRPQKLAVAS